MFFWQTSGVVCGLQQCLAGFCTCSSWWKHLSTVLYCFACQNLRILLFPLPTHTPRISPDVWRGADNGNGSSSPRASAGRQTGVSCVPSDFRQHRKGKLTRGGGGSGSACDPKPGTPVLKDLWPGSWLPGGKDALHCQEGPLPPLFLLFFPSCCAFFKPQWSPFIPVA